MELTSDYRIFIYEDRESALALAAERARIAAERAEDDDCAPAGLLVRLRRRFRVLRAVTR